MEEYKVDQMYQELGLSGEVIAYGRQVEDGLAERFRAIDETAEYNQIKVLRCYIMVWHPGGPLNFIRRFL